jgi:hypothetical protein
MTHIAHCPNSWISATRIALFPEIVKRENPESEQSAESVECESV